MRDKLVLLTSAILLISMEICQLGFKNKTKNKLELLLFFVRQLEKFSTKTMARTARSLRTANVLMNLFVLLNRG